MSSVTLNAGDRSWIRNPSGHPSDIWYRGGAERDLFGVLEAFSPDLVLAGGLVTQRYVRAMSRRGMPVVLDQANVETVIALRSPHSPPSPSMP